MRVELILGDPFRVVSHGQIPYPAGAPHPRLLSVNPFGVWQDFLVADASEWGY